MSTDFYIYAITKEFKKKSEELSKKKDISLNEVYSDNWNKIMEIGKWCNSSIFSNLVKEFNIEIYDGVYTELSKEILEKIKEKLITMLKERFEKTIITKLENFEMVYSNWDNRYEIGKIIEIINGVNNALRFVDFNTQIVLYRTKN